MAEAVIEERHLLKKLRWYDGFVIALATPGFLLGSLGYSVGDLGGWGAVLLWGISAGLAFFIMTLYSEMAAMFPDKPGGFPLYAHEGWRKYFTLVGPIATFGYWLAWSVVLAFLGVFSGQIITAAWFPDEPFGSAFFGSSEGEGYFSTGNAEIGLPHLIAIGLILAVWLFNFRGVRVAVGFGYLAGALLMVPLFVFMILPFLNGDFDSANLTWGALDGTAGSGDEATSVSTWEVVRLSLVWLWIMAWSSWGVDTCATFAPEYKDTVNDTKLALRSACIFTFVVYMLLPLGLVGGVGEETVAAFDYVGALETLTGSTALTNFFVIVIVASFVISMNTATADGSRALYGIARDDMTIKQLYSLNRWNVPGVAMTMDMVINICFVLFIGNIFGILAASNIGYVLAHFFAITGVHPAAAGSTRLAASDQRCRPSGCRSPGCSRSSRRCSRSSASSGSRRRRAATAARPRSSSASASWSSRSCSTSSGASSRTASGRTGSEETPAVPDERQAALLAEAARPVA